MKYFIPSAGRAASTPHYTAGLFPWATVLLHSEKEEAEYRKHGLSNPVLITGPSQRFAGKAVSMNAALERCVAIGEWICFADDDLRGIEALPSPYYEDPTFPKDTMPRKQAVALYKTSALSRLDDIFQDTIQEAERVGANLCSFATTNNYYFRSRKWGYASRVDGCLLLMRKTGHPVPLRHMDDMFLLAEHLTRDGAIVVNRYLFPNPMHFHPGGLGTVPERYHIRQKEIQELLSTYPGLFNGAWKAHKGDPYPDVRLRLSTREQVAKWRPLSYNHGYVSSPHGRDAQLGSPLHPSGPV